MTLQKLPLVITIAVYSVLLFIGIVNIAAEGPHDFSYFHEITFPILLMVGGLMFTSTVFYELNRKEQAMIYLTIPASTLEKFLSKWVLSTIGFTAFALFTYLIYSWVLNIGSLLFFGFTVESFNPFTDWVFFFIILYIPISSIHFLGALAFGKYAFFKTNAFTFLLSIASGFIGIAIFKVMMINRLPLFSFDGNLGPVNEGMINWVENTGIYLLIFFAWVIVPLILWAASYFKLSEKQV